jgi:hypothetical protein
LESGKALSDEAEPEQTIAILQPHDDAKCGGIVLINIINTKDFVGTSRKCATPIESTTTTTTAKTTTLHSTAATVTYSTTTNTTAATVTYSTTTNTTAVTVNYTIVARGDDHPSSQRVCKNESCTVAIVFGVSAIVVLILAMVFYRLRSNTLHTTADEPSTLSNVENQQSFATAIGKGPRHNFSRLPRPQTEKHGVSNGLCYSLKANLNTGLYSTIDESIFEKSTSSLNFQRAIALKEASVGKKLAKVHVCPHDYDQATQARPQCPLPQKGSHTHQSQADTYSGVLPNSSTDHSSDYLQPALCAPHEYEYAGIEESQTLEPDIVMYSSVRVAPCKSGSRDNTLYSSVQESSNATSTTPSTHVATIDTHC